MSLRRSVVSLVSLAALGALPARARAFCQEWGCGLNGAWLGENLHFHELDAAGHENSVGLRVVGFVKGNLQLRLEVRRAELIGIDKDHPAQAIRGCDLIGARILVAPRGERDAKYAIVIEGVGAIEYWVDPATAGAAPVECPTDPQAPRPNLHSLPVPFYRFKVVTLDHPESVFNLCSPDVPGEGQGVYGKVLIFRGDRYDARMKTASQTGLNDTWFNVACQGTAVSKMHLLRHTLASSDPGHTTTEAQRNAMLKLLTADYCGTGHSFTINRKEIRYRYLQSWLPITPYGDVTNTSSVDAVWSEHGAVCLDTPRLAAHLSSSSNWATSLGMTIKVDCRLGGHSLPKCNTDYRFSTSWISLPGAYGISATP